MNATKACLLSLLDYISNSISFLNEVKSLPVFIQNKLNIAKYFCHLNYKYG